MYKFNIIDKLSIALVTIGSLNWGLLGLLNLNLVELISKIFGGGSEVIQRIIYILVGAAALNFIYLILKLKSKKI